MPKIYLKLMLKSEIPIHSNLNLLIAKSYTYLTYISGRIVEGLTVIILF